MHYLTRHLVALRDLPLGDRLVPVGGTFYATEVDAEYLTGNKSAADAPPDAAVAFAWAPQTVAAVARAPAPTPVEAASAPAAGQADHAEPSLPPAESLAQPPAESPAAASAEPTAPAEAAASAGVADASNTGEADGAAAKAAEQGGDEAATAPASRRRPGRPSNAEIQARQAAAKNGASAS
jgi:hypothetical protein